MLYIATGNTTKFSEMEHALSRYEIAVTQKNVTIDEIQNSDQEQVVKKKALDAFHALQAPVIVDDSGIFFETFPSFPGTYSKYAYDALGIEGIFRLTAVGESATFVCAVAYMDANLSEPAVFWGKYEGKIIAYDEKNVLSKEMPYAAIFQPIDSPISLSRMTALERSGDHRNQALQSFAHWYKKER